MALIDLVKLNAELNEMIARQDEEIIVMNKKREETMAYKFEMFLTDIAERQEMCLSMKLEDVRIPLSFDWVSKYGVRHPYYLRFGTCEMRSVGIGMGSKCDTYIGCFDYNCDEYEEKKVKCSYGNCAFDIDEFLLNYESTIEEFHNEFEKIVIKAIEDKATKANERYKAVKRKFEEVCGECVIEDHVQ